MEKERDLVTTQIDRDVHTAMTLMKKMYKKRRHSDALRAFIAQHDPALIAAVRQIENLNRSAEDGTLSEDPDSDT
jgi:phosphoenolpyruvate carboxylase